MRHLATIRKIREVLPIYGADLIQLVKIDGWQCVAKVGEFQPGNLCVYFEIDSFLPIRPEFEFLRKSSFKKMGDGEGFRIKTVKLRGQLSQGLALPIPIFPDLGVDIEFERLNWMQAGCQGSFVEYLLKVDFSNLLGVQKYEPPVPAELAGQMKGNFPSFIPKTDEERCQNISDEIFLANYTSKYEVTMKMDGTSFTGYYNAGVTGCCGRNWELKVDDSNASNSLVRMFVDSGLQAVLASLGPNYAVQGELMGPGIQKNREGLKAAKLFIFNIYDIDNGKYLEPEARRNLVADMHVLGLKKDMVEHVPIIAHEANLLDTLGIQNVDQLLAFAEGAIISHPIREGLVFKRLDCGFSFKAISNEYLLREKS